VGVREAKPSPASAAAALHVIDAGRGDGARPNAGLCGIGGGASSRSANMLTPPRGNENSSLHGNEDLFARARPRARQRRKHGR
jgi:hypothetical protein